MRCVEPEKNVPAGFAEKLAIEKGGSQPATLYDEVDQVPGRYIGRNDRRPVVLHVIGNHPINQRHELFEEGGDTII